MKNLRIVTIDKDNVNSFSGCLTDVNKNLICSEKQYAIACVDGNIVYGILLFEGRENAIIIQGIHVSDETDSNILYEEMIKWIIDFSKDEGIGILHSFSGDERDLENIFKKLGFRIEESESKDITISYADIKTVKQFSKQVSIDHIFPPDKISMKLLNTFVKQHSEKSHLFSAIYDSKMIQRYAVVNGNIVGCILGQNIEGDFSIDYLYADSTHKPIIISLLKGFIDDVARIRETDKFSVHFTAVNQNSLLLAEKLLEGKGTIKARKTAVY